MNNQTGVLVSSYDSEGKCLQALLRGASDAFVGGGSNTWFRIREQNITGIKALATPWEMHSLCFGVRDPRLLMSIDDGWERLMRDGRYDQLYRRWFVQEPRKSELNAYAPYSRYAVGGAVQTSSDRVRQGLLRL
jgi:ABC-type amino acid transport substrate-binding protein